MGSGNQIHDGWDRHYPASRADRTATVNVLDKPWLNLTTPIGKGIPAFFSALAEDERERITRRANKGRQIAIASKTKFGSKPSLTEHQRQLARDRMANGHTFHTIALDLGGSYDDFKTTMTEASVQR